MIKILNRTPFAAHHQEGGKPPAEFSVLQPEPWQRVVQVVAKATFDITNGNAIPAVQQIPILAKSGPTDDGFMEGDLAFEKGGVDLVVLGQAHSPRAALVREMEVRLRVGPTVSSLIVTGDRVWMRRGNAWLTSDPVPFTTMGLDYDRAFGGIYALESGSRLSYPRNPIGKGWTPNMAGVVFEGRALPNIESTSRRAMSPEEELDPAGFGWYRMEFGIRMMNGVKFREGKPPEVLPRLWNGAHPDLLLPNYPSETPVRIEGMTPAGRIDFQIPRLSLGLEHSLNGQPESLPGAPDTICILPERGLMFVLVRWMVPVPPADPGIDRFVNIEEYRS